MERVGRISELATRLVLFPFFIVLAGIVPTPVIGGQATRSDGPGSMVQNFYDWYVQKALTAGTAPAWGSALNERRVLFSEKLASALEDDLQAQARVEGEIVGIDFDPFLATQDPCERYQVGSIAIEGARAHVDIFGVCDGKRHDKPDVTAELLNKNRRWVFVNFEYPEGGNLLKVLGSLRKERGR